MIEHKARIDTILVKVASRCNINCTYCYVYQMGDENWRNLDKFMSLETITALCLSLQELANNQSEGFSVVLHGGEPLLMGASRLECFLEALRGYLPNKNKYPISIQTNGILISDKILEICTNSHVSIAVSLDGPELINDKFRLDHKGEGTYQKVLDGIKKLESHSNSKFLYAGLLAVIDPSFAPNIIYDFFKKLNPPSVDFLYKDGNLSRLPIGKSSFASIEYGSWMAELLDIYMADNDSFSIRILDDMIKVLLGSNMEKEGMGVTDFGILIIDTDGTITKNDTLKSSYVGADQFENRPNIKDHNFLKFLHSEKFEKYRETQRPSCQECKSCPFLNVCGGGMTLHRWKDDNGFNNPSIYCNDQKYLITHIQSKLTQFGLYE